MMDKLKKQTWNLIIFLLLAINTVMLSSYFYKKFHHERLTIEILNGCGEEKIAAKVAEQLDVYNIILVENADNFDFEKTIVFARCKKNNKDLKNLCGELGFNPNRIIYQKNEQKLANVTIIVGKDYTDFPLFRNVPIR